MLRISMVIGFHDGSLVIGRAWLRAGSPAGKVNLPLAQLQCVSAPVHIRLADCRCSVWQAERQYMDRTAGQSLSDRGI